MSDLLLETKLFKPVLRPTLITRQHLIDRINKGIGIGSQGFTARLTLVSAPAGFGKTTLVSAWLAQLADLNSQLSGSQSAWLSLDENDNDPVRFLAYLIAALQTAVPNLGEGAAALLQSHPSPLPETILTLLINDFSHCDRLIILVLDDYHVITTPAVHQAVTFFLEHLPPTLHLLLTTRSDPPLPLSRLRARSQIIEIRANDLRFTTDEADQFLNQAMDLAISTEALATLQERTEGWIAGLQLAALSMQGRDDLTNFIAAFTGSNRFILDYLTDEVLVRRPKGSKNFLLQTSILNRLCGSLCDAVTGQSDSQSILEQLERANLFLIPLDEKRYWYRYHHLFADVLNRRLNQEQPDLVKELHGRAYAWFAEKGFVDDALGHALAAGELDLALTLVEQNAWPSLERGEYYTIRAWLVRLPSAQIRSRPGMVLIHGFVLAFTGHVDEAEKLLQDTVDLWEVPKLPSWQRGELAHLRAILARLRADMSASIEFASEALVYLTSERPARRISALINLLMVAIIQGDTILVEDALTQLTNLSALFHKSAQLDALHGASWLYIRRGQLVRAAQLQQQIIREADTLQTSRFLALGFAHTSLGMILYEQNDLSGAIEHLSKGIEYLQNSIEQVVMAASFVTLAKARLATGDTRALATLGEADNWMAKMRLDDLGFRRAMAVQRAQFDLKAGNLAAAEHWLEISDLPPVTRMPFYRYSEYLLMARIYMTKHQTKEALAVLDAVEAGVVIRQMNGQLIGIHCLRALALHACGEKISALRFLNQALTIAEPEGYCRIFLDEGKPMIDLLRQARSQSQFPSYFDKLLAAYSEDEIQKKGTDLLPDPLSERELQVLQLVASGASNKEIADQLFIAVSTVKKHMGNIMVKLDTPNRVQAITRARELGLLT